MLGCECLWWNQVDDYYSETHLPQPFSLPAPIPRWPPGLFFLCSFLYCLIWDFNWT
uniref:Uncharacterized protein n=1 Tax=Rhizophora mucronata TaxID=61149 RepID=A0A2P2J8U5_RHIMU